MESPLLRQASLKAHHDVRASQLRAPLALQAALPVRGSSIRSACQARYVLPIQPAAVGFQGTALGASAFAPEPSPVSASFDPIPGAGDSQQSGPRCRPWRVARVPAQPAPRRGGRWIQKWRKCEEWVPALGPERTPPGTVVLV